MTTEPTGAETSETAEAPEPDGAAVSASGRVVSGAMVLFGLFMIIVIMGTGLLGFSIKSGPSAFHVTQNELLVLGQAPLFNLIERSGADFDSSYLRGRIWIADFIFTRCAGICPNMSRSMAKIQKSLNGIPELWPPAMLLSFTVDPAWDTPEVLSEYADRYGADPERWLFLTGPESVMRKLTMEGFMLAVSPDGSSEVEPIMHSQSLVLVDPRGRIRGFYDGTDPAEIHQLLADVAKITRED